MLAEYRYNGVGHRIGEHFDVDADGTVEDTADDPWHYLAYDERWRLVARFTDTDTDPTEQWVHHQAGLNGAGGGSYIDGVIMRERDTDANGSLDERVYILQNWRADVIALTDTYGIPLEQIRYDAYGECFNIDPADWTTQGASSGNKGYGVPDGIITSADINYYVALYNASDAKSDVTTQGASQGTANYGWPDGSVTSVDINYYVNIYNAGQSTGRGNLSRTDIDNRLGYAGYTRDVAVNLYHVRFRVYNSELGRWTRRDPLAYVDGASLYQYVASLPVKAVDPYGDTLLVCAGTCAVPIDPITGEPLPHLQDPWWQPLQDAWYTWQRIRRDMDKYLGPGWVPPPGSTAPPQIWTYLARCGETTNNAANTCRQEADCLDCCTDIWLDAQDCLALHEGPLRSGCNGDPGCLAEVSRVVRQEQAEITANIDECDDNCEEPCDNLAFAGPGSSSLQLGGADITGSTQDEGCLR